MDQNVFFEIPQYLIPMILALTVHEYSHGLMAYILGDDTASRSGRLTLNPIAHIDMIGTILIPVFGIISGFPFIGWARPVPISPLLFTRKISMKTGIFLTSIAGPLSNLLFAVIIVAIFKIFSLIFGQSILNNQAFTVLVQGLLLINIGLFVFNMLPIPPLDGSKVLLGLLPDSFENVYHFLERYSFIFFILIIAGFGRFLAYPIYWLYMKLMYL